MKIKEKENARILRQSGQSIKNIAKKLKVSAGTVSGWVKDIKLTVEQERETLTKGQQAARHNRIAHFINKRKQLQDHGIKLLKSYDFESQQRIVAMCMLYWGEGAKSLNRFIIINSDVDLLIFVRNVLVNDLKINLDRLNIHIYCYTDLLDVETIENYWSEQLKIPRSQFTKSFKLKSTSQNKRRDKNPYGTVRLTITKSCQEVQNVYGIIKYVTNHQFYKWIS